MKNKRKWAGRKRQRKGIAIDIFLIKFIPIRTVPGSHISGAIENKILFLFVTLESQLSIKVTPYIYNWTVSSCIRFSRWYRIVIREKDRQFYSHTDVSLCITSIRKELNKQQFILYAKFKFMKLGTPINTLRVLINKKVKEVCVLK